MFLIWFSFSFLLIDRLILELARGNRLFLVIFTSDIEELINLVIIVFR